jgi:tetratricopeptide (TPR) repeat protein
MREGRYDEARRILEEALAEKDAGIIHYQLACTEALAGNRDRALDELETAVAMEDRFGTYAATDEDFAPLRDDPRFLRVARQADAEPA